jgi:hypothetical protein
LEQLVEVIFGFSMFSSFLPLRILLIWPGIKWAKIKGVSKLWMLFGVHPKLDWISFPIIRYGIDPKNE